MTKQIKLAVLGNPVAHSKSPEIHEMFARQFGDNVSYTKIEVELGGFDEKIEELIEEHYLGVNVTIPFKVDAYRSAVKCSSRARQSRAANTLKFSAGKVSAENTDGIGFVTDLQKRLGFDPSDKKVLILGAGGSVRGILPALLDAGPKNVTVANRTLARANQLQEEFGILSMLYEDIGADVYDLIINATPVSLQNKAPLIGLSAFEGCTVAYDLVYAAEPTLFMQMAQEAGVRCVSDGLGMLVEQAAYSYQFWLEKLPKTEDVYEQLRSSLK
jgi:shikimate dehydrogenase